MNSDDSKLYVVEALWDTGWKYDDFAATDYQDAVAAMKRVKKNCPDTDFRIKTYVSE